jgi:hypothetical protein
MWIENTLFGFKMGNVNGKWLWLCWKYVKNGWVMSKMGGSCQKWVGHVKNGWVASKMGGSRRKWVGRIENGWVMSKMGQLCQK